MSDAEFTSEDIATVLRQELKLWEKSFRAANGGRKASRDDIKKDVVIAAKYREYDRIRYPPPPQPKKLQAPPPESNRPSRRDHITSTPQKPALKSLAPPPIPVPGEEEEHEIEPTPAAVRVHLGPTPQKDGQILSLFDILSSAGSATPSKRTNPSRHALSAIETNIAHTPSKPSTAIEESPAVRASRTPASSGKRFLLDSFATPLKRKRDDDEEAGGAREGASTPNSAKKSEGSLATPAFLRRTSNMLIMDTLIEEAEKDDDDAVARVRLPLFKRNGGLVRSLSTLIRGLRQQEDDRLDEEMDMLREMEDESFAPVRKVESQPQHRKDEEVGAAVLVEDSQVAMPLGPDRGFESSESEEEDVPGRDGKPRKPWKKKGLKRQTKRVIMRPVTHKPKSALPQPDADATALSDTELLDTTTVPETQLQGDSFLAPLDDSESDFSASESQARKKRKKQSGAAKDVVAAAPVAVAGMNEKEKEVGPIKKAAKKISATAHANFKKLKIKNQNSKAGGRRFGRR